MTLTVSRPAQPPDAPSSEVAGASLLLPESPFTTSDHKRIGRYYIAAGILFVLVGTAIALLLELQLSSSGANITGNDLEMVLWLFR